MAIKPQGIQEGQRIFEKSPPLPMPQYSGHIVIAFLFAAFLSKTSCHRNLSLSALRASDPLLRSVNRPIGPWLSTHDEATKVLWHREGRTFFKDSLPFLDSL